MARNQTWSRDELIAAFNLYCRIPFGRIHTGNPAIRKLAEAIGRTPSAVSWKLANFARLDPSLRARSISGATHGSKQEEEVWTEFHDNWERLAFESELALSRITRIPIEETVAFPEGLTRESIVRVRVNQRFFRAAVLAAYDSRCCITGIEILSLLTASHIVPWSVDVKNRTNPRNGLCLNALHDRAFDCGLMTIREGKVLLSPKIKKKKPDEPLSDMLLRYEGFSVSIPEKFAPDPRFMDYHFQNIFQR